MINLFGEREKALEAGYFRQQDAKLLAELRKGSTLDSIAAALRDKLKVDNRELLERARHLGVTAETAPAFLLAPLVQAAWADGSVGTSERQLILRLAADRGVDAGSAAQAQLAAWLDARPDDALFETSTEVIRFALSVLPPRERDQRIAVIVEACRLVAQASGGQVTKLIGLGDGISASEAALLVHIEQRLRAPV